MKQGAQFWLRIAIAVFFLALLYLAPTIILPFGISLILSTLLSPVARYIQKTIHHFGFQKFPYDLSIILSFGLFILVIYLLIIGILAPFITQFKEFIYNVPAALQALEMKIPQVQAVYEFTVMPPEIQGIFTDIVKQIGNYSLRVAQFSLSAVFSFATTVVELIVVPFLTFYMMKKGSAFIQWFIDIFPQTYRSHLKIFFSELHFVLTAYIRGQLALCAIMGCVVFLGMEFLNIPYPLVIGLLAAIVELIPMIGPIIGAIPPVLLALLQGSSVALKVIVFYIIVQQLDGHFVMPKLMGSIIRVHPVAIIAGVLIGGHIFGVVGMMVAVPLTAVIQVVLKHLWFYNFCRQQAKQTELNGASVNKNEGK